MGPEITLVVLRAADLNKSRRFYEALGLRFCTEQHGNGPEHLAAAAGEVTFEIYPSVDSDLSTGTRIGFRVKNVHETMVTLQGVGGEIATPPKAEPWGLRAVLIDPDGLRIEISQPIEPE
jgi:lactoylglutathione lyase